MMRSALVVGVLTAVAVGEPWDSNNDPTQFSSKFNYKFSLLKQTARTSVIPWSDTYWPSYQGGIANRWQDDQGGDPGFNYKLHSKAEITSGEVDISKLSPSEKYDIYSGRFDYPLTKSEWGRVNPQDPEWEGLCHGWVPASEDYQQPDACEVTSADGIKVPFASSDVKALLTYFLAQYSDDAKTNFAGQRCNTDLDANPEAANKPECRDINAGAWLVILANQIAEDRAFAIDIDRSVEVWNQPAFGYTFSTAGSRKPSHGAAPGTESEVRVLLNISYVKELEPQVRAGPPLQRTEAYDLWVELGSDNSILGGSWNSDGRPDFAWSESVTPFFGYLKCVEPIYKASIAGRSPARVALAQPAEVLPRAIAEAIADARARSGLLRSAPRGERFVAAAQVASGSVAFVVPASANVTATGAAGGAGGMRVRVFQLDSAVAAADVRVGVMQTALVGRAASGRSFGGVVTAGEHGAVVVVDAPRVLGGASGEVLVRW